MYRKTMNNFPDIRLNLGDYIDAFISWLTEAGAGVFDFIYFIFNYFYYQNMREGII